MQCPKCKQDYAARFGFCPHCGTANPRPLAGGYEYCTLRRVNHSAKDTFCYEVYYEGALLFTGQLWYTHESPEESSTREERARSQVIARLVKEGWEPPGSWGDTNTLRRRSE